MGIIYYTFRVKIYVLYYISHPPEFYCPWGFPDIGVLLPSLVPSRSNSFACVCAGVSFKAAGAQPYGPYPLNACKALKFRTK